MTVSYGSWLARDEVPPLGHALDLGNAGAEICVVGRCDFNTSIGLLTYGYAEMWSRNLPVCIRPTEPHLQAERAITLPNGRIVPTWQGQAIKASIFVDVFWNGAADRNYLLVPQTGLRLACIVWDSDQFPEEWISLLNTRYDAAVATSPHLEEVLARSGCRVPIVTVPPALDLEPLLRRPFVDPERRLRVGSVAAYHPRKGTPALLEAFADAFGGRDDVELLLHSNLVFPQAIERVHKRVDALGIADKVVVSTAALSIADKTDLLETIDLFANLSRGEGYSIGVREALALGKPCVLSEVGGHRELAGTPGVFMVPARQRVAARYPEIDNRVFGEQRAVDHEDAVAALRAAVDYLGSGEARRARHLRRDRAADFSFARLSTATAELVAPDIRAFRKGAARPPEAALTDAYRKLARHRIAGEGGLSSRRHRIVQMHDGGFFSIFNAFFSHLVWDLQEERCHRVLPDWDVGRFLQRQGDREVVSFCYGQPADGNIWTKLFEPLFGLGADGMQDEALLYDHATRDPAHHNEAREPLLTYVHAYELYRRPWFAGLRRHYHRVLRDHVHLEPSLDREVAGFVDANMRGRIVLGAHVRHPSHTVEQPDAVIAHADLYIDTLKRVADERGLTPGQWAVFLATDQERVVERFRDSFGERLCLWEQARRTTDAEDARFDALAGDDRNRDGFQLQHLVASTRAAWSIDMAREVVRDAYLMSTCDTLLHVVSNVSTAASFINPRCELRFCG